MRKAKKAKKANLPVPEEEFTLTAETKQRLRAAFLQSLEDLNEYAGAFVLMDEGKLVMRDADEQGSHGYGWTGVVGSESSFTWHTHPILFEKGSDCTSPLNRGSSMLPSGEDLMGCVQDSLLLQKTGAFLSNPNGSNKLDVICTAPGLLVLGAAAGIVEQWLQMCRFDEDNKKQWCQTYGVKVRKGDSLAKLKRKVERQAFAQVENSYNFKAFKAHCGAFGYLEEGIFRELEVRFGHAGYHSWWSDEETPGDELSEWDTGSASTRAASVQHVQHRWFKSDAFLSVDVASSDPQVMGMIQYLRQQGFACCFLNWDLANDAVFSL